MNHPWKRGGRVRRDAALRAEIRRLTALLEHARVEKERLVLDKAAETDRRHAAELRCEATAGLLATREHELAESRARYAHVWGQVKTLPPVPFPAAVTVVNAGIPAVLPVKAAKAPLHVPRWVPKAETLAETTQPIPLAERERRQTSSGAANQDSETTQELPLPQPQTAAS